VALFEPPLSTDGDTVQIAPINTVGKNRMNRGIAILLCCVPFFCAAANAGDKAIDASTEKDLRCIFVGSRMANADNAMMRASALPVMLYYLGRVDGRTPNLELENAITAVAVKTAKEPPELLRATAVRCGKEMQSRGAVMDAVGRRLIERGRTMRDIENSR